MGRGLGSKTGTPRPSCGNHNQCTFVPGCCLLHVPVPRTYAYRYEGAAVQALRGCTLLQAAVHQIHNLPTAMRPVIPSCAPSPRNGSAHGEEVGIYRVPMVGCECSAGASFSYIVPALVNGYSCVRSSCRIVASESGLAPRWAKAPTEYLCTYLPRCIPTSPSLSAEKSTAILGVHTLALVYPQYWRLEVARAWWEKLVLARSQWVWG